MKTAIFFFLIFPFITSMDKSIYDFEFTTIDGEKKSFAEFKGKHILIVNTASKCGYTKQYENLQNLYKTYNSKLVIIGFPANNFGGQEPGSNSEIKSFCKKNYGVSFLMSEKVSVKGDDIEPLFEWLIAQENPSFTGDINWNFEKFLFDDEGKLVARFRSKTKPDDPELTALIQ
ncbi:glutathione peroxidase [Flexithrix dorotheae]|uniref:glutathione peroxidase n=1 Tax=Flexithrix dorotheae TaxID=70993 RepID=UPI00036DA170|nr:glutathione peroxidase [Flexithrix dorotheae]